MTKGFFITGTDTGVGKTVISAALITLLNSTGYKTGGMKPIESGCKKQGTRGKGQGARVKNQENRLVPQDGMFLKKTACMDDSVDLITPLRFREPLAPLTASEIEGRPVDIKKIKKAFLELSKKYDALLVEGIGGLLVPVRKKYFVIDLAKYFGLPLIVVAKPSLGTLNHTLLTVNYAIKEGLQVAGIIINFSQPPANTIAEKTNPETLKKISPVPLIGIFPYLENMEIATIQKAASENLNAGIIRKFL